MKNTKFLKAIIALMFAGMFFIPSKADAKLFGKECYTETSGGGESCVTTKTVCKQRFFGINVGTSISVEFSDCPMN